MSRRAKHVTQGSLQGACPVPEEGQELARVTETRGSNLIEVGVRDGSTTLVRLPAKFHKKLWVKRGGFVIIERGDEDQSVSGEIVHVLYPDHIRELKKMPGVWPEEFTDDAEVIPDVGRIMLEGERKGLGGVMEGVYEGPTSLGREEDGGGEGGGGEEEGDYESESDDGLPPLQANTNHRVVEYSDDSSDED